MNIKSIKRYEPLNRFFDNQSDGWIGSDVCHSIDLGNEKILYLFGDTLIGKSFNQIRSKDFNMINNSVGIMTLNKKAPVNISFHWKNDNGARSIFKQPQNLIGDFLWPTNGIIYDDSLYIFCMAVNSTPDFSIDIEGTIIVKVKNYLDDPNQWCTEYWDFEFSGGIIHSGIYLKNNWLYFLGAKTNVFENNMILARIGKDQIARKACSEELKFYTRKGKWSAEINEAKSMFFPGNSESNIYFQKKSETYFTTTYVPKNNKMYLLSSKKLSGPWSRPKHIYTIPECEKKFSVVSYAMRIHSWISDINDSLVISYATNEFGGMDNLFTHDGCNIYRPYFIEVQL